MKAYARPAVEAALPYAELVERLASAFVLLSRGEVSMPPRAAARVERLQAYLGAMPAYLPEPVVLACKLVSVFPGNAAAGLPTHHAVLVAFDPETGVPAAIMDAEAITARRTAGASALAARLLGPPQPWTLAVLGSGVQAHAHLEAFAELFRLREAVLWGRTAERVRALAERAEELGLRWRTAGSAEEAVRAADVVVLATHAERALFDEEAVAPGTHLCSVGLNPNGEGELPYRLLRRARLVVESRTSAFAPPPAGAPELALALAEGLIKSPEEAAELGELIEGSQPGRTSPDEVTVYKSVGVAVEDAAAASLVLERANPTGEVELGGMAR